MRVLYTPQVNDETAITYRFNGDIIEFEMEDEKGQIDLSNIESDKLYKVKFPIQEIYVEQGQIHVRLLHFIPDVDENDNPYVDNNTYEWHTPEEEPIELVDPIQLEEEIIPDAPEETDTGIEGRIEVLSQAVEELIILTSMQAGGFTDGEMDMLMDEMIALEEDITLDSTDMKGGE